ncbi:MAG: DoxX family membrane protein [Akkermansia sp.]|nr:DoxX family membrane protein [Akkermansia sp.]
MRNSRSTDVLLSLLRIGLGVFFLVTGVLKIGELGETADFLTRSELLPEFFSMPLACIGIAMELVVAVCLVFRMSYRGAAIWGSVMTGVFLVLYAQAWARGLSLSCNCLGSTHEIVNYPQDTGVRLLLLGAMLLLVWDSRRYGAFSNRKPRSFDFSDAA